MTRPTLEPRPDQVQPPVGTLRLAAVAVIIAWTGLFEIQRGRDEAIARAIQSLPAGPGGPTSPGLVGGVLILLASSALAWLIGRRRRSFRGGPAPVVVLAAATAFGASFVATWQALPVVRVADASVSVQTPDGTLELTDGTCYSHAGGTALWFVQAGGLVSGDLLGGEAGWVGVEFSGRSESPAVGDHAAVHFIRSSFAFVTGTVEVEWRDDLVVSAIDPASGRVSRPAGATGPARTIAWTCSDWRSIRVPSEIVPSDRPQPGTAALHEPT